MKNEFLLPEQLINHRTVYADIKQMIISKRQRYTFIFGITIYALLGFLLYDAQPVQRPDINVFHIVHFWQGVVTGICFSNLPLAIFFNLVHELIEFQTSNETPVDKLLDPIVFFIGYGIANKLFLGKVFPRLKDDLRTYFNKERMYVFTFDFVFALIAWVVIQLTLVFGGIIRSVFNQESLPISQIVNTLLIFTNLYTIFLLLLTVLVIFTPLLVSAWTIRKSFYNINDFFSQYIDSGH